MLTNECLKPWLEEINGESPTVSACKSVPKGACRTDVSDAEATADCNTDCDAGFPLGFISGHCLSDGKPDALQCICKICA